MGMPVECWLLEFKGKTYGDSGNEEAEPIFTGVLKAAVASKMKELSCHAFADGMFSYESLADALRQPNVDLIRLTVKHVQKESHKYRALRGMKVATYPELWQLVSK